MDSRGGYVWKILYVETKEIWTLRGRRPMTLSEIPPHSMTLKAGTAAILLHKVQVQEVAF